MKSKKTLYLTRGAMIAALYTALTAIAAVFALDKGVIQFRISEALVILPLFMPEAVIGLTVGCLISNLLLSGAIYDIIFGTLATLIGAIGTRLMKKLPKKLLFLATLPPILSNSIIIPFVLRYAYQAEGTYWFFFLTVGIGEILTAGILASILGYAIANNKKLTL